MSTSGKHYGCPDNTPCTCASTMYQPPFFNPAFSSNPLPPMNPSGNTWSQFQYHPSAGLYPVAQFLPRTTGGLVSGPFGSHAIAPHYQQTLSLPPEPDIFRQVVFADTTSHIVNTQTTSSRKRKNASDGSRSSASSSKRRNTACHTTQNTNDSDGTLHRSELPTQNADVITRISSQSTPGVGPQVSDSNVCHGDRRTVHPSLERTAGLHRSLLVSDGPSTNVAQATDVWYFMRGLQTEDRPESMRGLVCAPRFPSGISQNHSDSERKFWNTVPPK